MKPLDFPFVKRMSGANKEFLDCLKNLVAGAAALNMTADKRAFRCGAKNLQKRSMNSHAAFKAVRLLAWTSRSFAL